MNSAMQIPDGFKQDAKGRLIPESQIKPIDMERSDLVIRLIDQAKQQQQSLRDFKALVFGDIAAFVQLSAEQYEVNIGGAKGNLTLFSFDGKYKVVRQCQDSIRFDERLQAAKALIDECIQSWSANSNDNLKALINDAFQVDKEGKISTGRVLGLRRLNIDDAKWQQAMQAISDSIIVTDSKNYVRFYERDEDGKYQPISLDFANI
ncbi:MULTISPECIES: DUF3164 family protein [Acinetobacter]|uniref:DUF3164 family protein n=1 Tax=Acinetobacter ursingii TaxID=108980 RepID=A0A7T9Z5Q6_9GAMM|nr:MULTISPECIES: DUF3164 family protein [Acinetobacter]ENX48787.1 hypothetical protein F943_02324 [Acinetobacter ursingii NIPH 706]EXD37928.1 hypothetical protein J500_0389 [Acinetobacter sp. 479375]MCH2014676.1 DUF3164 family protein [Acinetobacter ursingii]MCU4587434.1 DUF3164 family protein [Acinetobacter ursingii]QQT85797.1 DUF3164 family protein [Acinetobacter ursingii]